MRHKILSIILLLVIINCHLIIAEEQDILKEIQSSSKGIEFGSLEEGSIKAKFTESNSELTYIDTKGQKQTLSGIKPSEGSFENYVVLNKDGKIVKADYQVGDKDAKHILGNLNTDIPANSRVSSNNGKNFQVLIPEGSQIREDPAFNNENKLDDSVVKFRGKGITLPSGKIIDGVIEHDGSSYALNYRDNTRIGVTDYKGDVKYLEMSRLVEDNKFAKLTEDKKDNLRTRVYFDFNSHQGSYLQIQPKGRTVIAGGIEDSYHIIDFPKKNYYNDNAFSLYAKKNGLVSVDTLAYRSTVIINDNAGIQNGIHTLLVDDGKISIDKFRDGNPTAADISVEFQKKAILPAQTAQKSLYGLKWNQDNSFDFKYYEGQVQTPADIRVRLNPFPEDKKSIEYLLEASTQISSGNIKKGSGTFFGRDGNEAFLLTAAHVLREDPIKSRDINPDTGYQRQAGSKNIVNPTIELFGSNAGQKLEGKLVAMNDERDIAIVKVRVPQDMNLATVPIGNPFPKEESKGMLASLFGSRRADEQIICIGCGKYNQPFATKGKIEGYIVKSGEREMNYFTRAQVLTTKGDSGGGVINNNGEIIGVRSYTNGATSGHVDVSEIRKFLSDNGLSKFHN